MIEASNFVETFTECIKTKQNDHTTSTGIHIHLYKIYITWTSNKAHALY